MHSRRPPETLARPGRSHLRLMSKPFILANRPGLTLVPNRSNCGYAVSSSLTGYVACSVPSKEHTIQPLFLSPPMKRSWQFHTERCSWATRMPPRLNRRGITARRSRRQQTPSQPSIGRRACDLITDRPHKSLTGSCTRTHQRDVLRRRPGGNVAALKRRSHEIRELIGGAG